MSETRDLYLAHLERENAELRAELRNQWEHNHSEHCDRVFPHTDGTRCHWPVPVVLARSKDNAAV
jgi:hypothetical protein